jgi:hypothetical protein
MTANVGTFDRIARVIIGIALIAFALGYIAPGTSWAWVGWIGVVPLPGLQHRRLLDEVAGLRVPGAAQRRLTVRCRTGTQLSLDAKLDPGSAAHHSAIARRRRA